MNLNPGPFEMIKTGQKTIELRLNDERRKNIAPGDIIEFTNTGDPSAKLSASVIGIHRFDSFSRLYQALPLLKCGYTPENVASASASDMDVYYTPQQQKQYGVLGIELSLL